MRLIRECDEESYSSIVRSVTDFNESGRHVKESLFPVYLSAEKNLDRLLQLLKTPDSALLIFASDISTACQLLEQGIAPGKLIAVGTREHNTKELQTMRNSRLREFSMKNISFEGAYDVCDSVMESLNKFQALFILVELNVLDPAFVNAAKVSPGGMSSRELLYFLQRLKNLKNLAAVDFLGVLEDNSLLCAKLVTEVL